MDIQNADRATWRRFVDEHGWDALLAALGLMAPEFDLYAVSKDWHVYGAEGGFLLKAKGTRGDLLVRFAD